MILLSLIKNKIKENEKKKKWVSDTSRFHSFNKKLNLLAENILSKKLWNRLSGYRMIAQIVFI